MSPRLRWPALAALFAVGCLGGLVGDAGHVASGTLHYLDPGVPMIWRSSAWFGPAVGGATASLAVIRLRFGPDPRAARQPWAEALSAVAAIVGLYALTAALRDQPPAVSVTIVGTGAVLVWRALGAELAGGLCGVLAAVIGPVVESALVHAGTFEYAPDLRQLAGVPLWLPLLYFAFGAVAARLGEIAAQRHP